MPPSLQYSCEILKVLLSNHKHGGSPIGEQDILIKTAAPSHDLDIVKDNLEEMRYSQEFHFVLHQGNRGVLIDNSHLEDLVDYLYNICEYDEFKIENMTRHYDVYKHHDFD